MNVKGKEAFEKQLARIPAAMKDEIRKAIVTSAEEMVDVAKRFAPIKAGALRDSIGWKVGAASAKTETSASNARSAKSDEGLVATVFAGGEGTEKSIRGGTAEVVYDYAFAAEFGNRRQRAQPFFFPAYRLTKKRAKARLQRAINAGAKKAFNK